MDNSFSVQVGLDNICTISCVWKLRKGSKSKTIPKKHIEFVKDSLAHIVIAENDVEIGNEADDEDMHELCSKGYC